VRPGATASAGRARGVPYRSSCQPPPTVVVDRLDSAIDRLRLEYPNLTLLLGGDFNQGMTGYLTGGWRGRDRLVGFPERHGLDIYTADSPSSHDGAGSIDHLCGTAKAGAMGWVHGRRRPRPVEACK